MNELTLENLIERLARLERENRRWRGGAMLALMLAIAVLLMGQIFPKAQVIEAHRFVLKSPDGKVRAILGERTPEAKAPAPGEPWIPTSDWDWGLHIYGADGGYRAGLVARPYSGGEEGAHLLLLDKNTATRADLLVSGGLADVDLSATVKTSEQTEQQQAEWAKKFRAARTGEERVKVSQAMRKAMQPEMNARLLVLAKGNTSLTFEEQGRSRAVLGMTELEKAQDGAIEKRPLSSLVLFNKDGKVIWQAP